MPVDLSDAAALYSKWHWSGKQVETYAFAGKDFIHREPDNHKHHHRSGEARFIKDAEKDEVYHLTPEEYASAVDEIQGGKQKENNNSSIPKSKNKPTISVEGNIPDPVTTPDTNTQQNKDFAEPYREFYQNLAKKEKSQYSEDNTSPYYKATLVRKDNSELNIVATPDNQVSLGAKDKDKKAKIPDNKDFENLALLAKKSGMSISFGEIKSPEFKARLMLACLENDVKMKNIPNFSELKDITPQTMQPLKDRLKEHNSTKGKATTKGGGKNPNVQVLPQAAKFSPLMGQVLKQKGGR